MKGVVHQTKHLVVSFSIRILVFGRGQNRCEMFPSFRPDLRRIRHIVPNEQERKEFAHLVGRGLLIKHGLQLLNHLLDLVVAAEQAAVTCGFLEAFTFGIVHGSELRPHRFGIMSIFVFFKGIAFHQIGAAGMHEQQPESVEFRVPGRDLVHASHDLASSGESLPFFPCHLLRRPRVMIRNVHVRQVFARPYVRLRELAVVVVLQFSACVVLRQFAQGLQSLRFLVFLFIEVEPSLQFGPLCQISFQRFFRPVFRKHYLLPVLQVHW